MEISEQTHEFTPPNPPAAKMLYASGRSRSLGQQRYTPFGGRPQHGLSPLVTHGHPQNNSLVSGSDGFESFGRGGAGGNAFFPPCSYSSM